MNEHENGAKVNGAEPKNKVITSALMQKENAC